MNHTFIIAELSANHNGSLNIAKQTIEAAKEAGADAVKLQTYTADTITIDSDKDCFIEKGGLWDGYSLYRLYKEAYTPWEWHDELFSYAHSLGLVCFSTPFDFEAADYLDHYMDYYKISSSDITNIPFIKHIAKKINRYYCLQEHPP